MIDEQQQCTAIQLDGYEEKVVLQRCSRIKNWKYSNFDCSNKVTEFYNVLIELENLKHINFDFSNKTIEKQQRILQCTTLQSDIEQWQKSDGINNLRWFRNSSATN